MLAALTFVEPRWQNGRNWGRDSLWDVRDNWSMITDHLLAQCHHRYIAGFKFPLRRWGLITSSNRDTPEAFAGAGASVSNLAVPVRRCWDVGCVGLRLGKQCMSDIKPCAREVWDVGGRCMVQSRTCSEDGKSPRRQISRTCTTSGAWVRIHAPINRHEVLWTDRRSWRISAPQAHIFKVADYIMYF